MTRYLVAGVAGLLMAFPIFGQDSLTVNGSGTFSSVVTNPSEALDPPCVLKVTRRGSVTFTGLLTGENGTIDSTTLSNRCGEVPQGPVVVIYRLNDVTVNGKKGGLVIFQRGTFEGVVDSANGARVTSHIEVMGVSGELKGVTGFGIVTSRSVASGTTNTYWCQLQFPALDSE
ncbi:MAG: hypothetical protein JST93_04050 [Acidobacteria bacterium]|nr:hypothetical protein [Acidobacteriota bacterium]